MIAMHISNSVTESLQSPLAHVSPPPARWPARAGILRATGTGMMLINLTGYV